MRLPRISNLFPRPLLWLCALALIVSFFLPTAGLGIPTCTFHAATNRPCFGCGLTRGVTNISHLNFQDAWHYHPFSFAAWAVMVLATIAGICRPVERFLHRKLLGRTGQVLDWFFWCALALFVLFGFWRFFAVPNWPGLH